MDAKDTTAIGFLEMTLAGGRSDSSGEGEHGGKARGELRKGEKCGGARRDRTQ